MSEPIQAVGRGINKWMSEVNIEFHACGLLVEIVEIIEKSKKWKSVYEYMKIMAYVPDRNTQIIIMSYALKDRTKKYMMYLRQQGDLFMTVSCNRCKNKCYVAFMKKDKVNTNGAAGHCKNCHADKVEDDKLPQIIGDQKEVLRRKLYEKIDSSHHLHKKVLPFFNTLCRQGNINALPAYIENPLATRVCTGCKTSKPLYNFKSAPTSKSGFNSVCNGCYSNDLTEMSIRRMRARDKKRGFEVSTDYEYRTIYCSQIDEHTGTYKCSVSGGAFGLPGDPREFNQSVDREHRTEAYSKTNGKLVPGFLNASTSAFNYDRKRHSQVEAAKHMPTVCPRTYTTFITEGENVGVPHHCAYMYKGCRERAMRRIGRGDDSWMCTIGPREIYAQLIEQDFRCAHTGVPLYLLKYHPWSASVDRIDNSKGYVPGNIRIVILMLNPGDGYVVTYDLFAEFLSRTTMQNKIERAAEFGYELDADGMPAPSAAKVLMERPVEYKEEALAGKRPPLPVQEDDEYPDVNDDGNTISTSRKRKRGGR